MRAYSATVGDTDGNIIAAIITIHTPRNHPSAPRSVPGPSSIPRMRSTVDHQATTARAKRSATRPRRARAAAKAGASPRSCVDAITTSGGPGELGGREARPSLELDTERVDPCTRRLRDGEVRPGGMEDARDPRRLPGLDAEGNDVFDLEIDGVADLHAVPKPILADLDRRSLDAEVLADERRQTRHR